MTPYDQALTCAKASEVIYSTDQDSANTMQGLGFGSFKWFDMTTVFQDICVFIVTSNEYHLLVFRGTKLPQDWMTDLAWYLGAV